MKILVDADACPVKDIIMNLAAEYNIEVEFYIDTSHELYGYNAKIITVDKGMDAVDIKIANNVKKGDVVITQDYGVAAICLSKGAYVIGNSGLLYTNDNIDSLLYKRYLGAKLRKRNKHITKKKKRNTKDDKNFTNTLNKVLESIKGKD